MGVPTWTAKADARLRKLWAEGLSTRLIGEKMGITKNAVVGRARRLGLDGRTSPIIGADHSNESAEKRRVQRKTARALYNAGMQRAQIAARMDLSPDYVSNLLRGVGQGRGRPSRMAAGLGLPPVDPAPKPALPTMHAKPAPMQDSSPAMQDRASVAPPVQVQPPAARCCKWPLWGDRERPTHRYCEARTATRRDGVPDVYCAAHRDKATAKTRVWGMAA